MRESGPRSLALLSLTVSLLLTAPLHASELPVRSFTTADGLSDNRVHTLVMDSRGLLWLCTASGISRFDGSHFQNFDDERIMPSGMINDLLETPDGYFWLAANGGGVIRFPLSSGGRGSVAFQVSQEPTSNRVNRLYRSPDGTMWAGTDGGLYRMTMQTGGRPVFARVALHLRAHPDATVQVWSMESDAEGSLWIGTRFGLVRMLANGRMISYPLRPGLETDHVFSILYDGGLLWIGHQSGLTIFKPPPATSSVSEGVSSYTEEKPSLAEAGRRPKSVLDANIALPSQAGESVDIEVSRPGTSPRVSALIRGRSGTIHVLGVDVIVQFSAGRFTLLTDPRFHAAMGPGTEDRDGNLWIASQAGALRVARQGFITFGSRDGLGPLVPRVFVNHTGQAIAISEGWRVSRFDGERFQTVSVNVPASVYRTGSPPGQGVIADHAGDWWFGTTQGLFRFAGVRRIEDLATIVPRRYSSRDGLAQDDVRLLFEDSRSGIWCAGLIPGHDVLARWDRGSGRFRKYSDGDGLQAFNSPTSFYEDPRGVIWITFRDGGIARYDAEADRFRMLTEANGLLPGGIGSAIADHAGRLWCPSARLGLYRIDDLNAARLRPDLVATRKQLGGQQVSRIVEDARGSIYAVTTRSVIRIDEIGSGASTTWRIGGLYSTDDGLAGGEVQSAARDGQGRLWFSTMQGVSYFEPKTREGPLAPEVRIGGLRIAGIEQPISPAGQESVSDLELAPGRSQLEIDFFGISFAVGESLTFEHRLVGADEEWSAPSPSQSVLFSNLAPGRYQFEVRAVSASGVRSLETARAAVRVLPPVWRRWWFVTLAAGVVLSGLASFERYRAAHTREIARAREERLAELEQVRKRIAADLHDEIGSSLTQISILSEVAVQQGAHLLPEISQPLSVIAASSRELVDAMSDIVWAINPARDHLSDLTQRMRRLAADMFTASNTAFRLELPAFDEETKLGANVRREVFLIFKEAVTNIIKHAGCTEAFVALTIENGVLRLEVRDNGRGFDTSVPPDGHGLGNLRSRTAALEGTLTVVSAPGAGTTIILHLPITT
jgi:signal transduction histidine kinase/ligand-binding sensor domain-containing protein